MCWWSWRIHNDSMTSRHEGCEDTVMNRTTIVALSLLSLACRLCCGRAVEVQAVKNAFGQPDITGVWSNATTTPFERPTEFSNRLEADRRGSGSRAGRRRNLSGRRRRAHRSVRRRADVIATPTRVTTASGPIPVRGDASQW